MPNVALCAMNCIMWNQKHLSATVIQYDHSDHTMIIHEYRIQYSCRSSSIDWERKHGYAVAYEYKTHVPWQALTVTSCEFEKVSVQSKGERKHLVQTHAQSIVNVQFLCTFAYTCWDEYSISSKAISMFPKPNCPANFKTNSLKQRNKENKLARLQIQLCSKTGSIALTKMTVQENVSSWQDSKIVWKCLENLRNS